MTSTDTGDKPKIRTYSWVFGCALGLFCAATVFFAITALNDRSGQAIAMSFVFGSLCVTVAIQWRNEHQSYHQHEQLKRLLGGETEQVR